MDDTISRQAAIDAIHEDADWLAAQGSDWQVERMERDKSILKSLPTVQPKRGHWILDRSGAYCCSECMEPCATYVMTRPRDRFCKMCGADMRCSENPNS